MKLAKMMLAGCVLTAVAMPAWAEETLTGTVMQIDRLSGTITVQQSQGGTVGASGGKVDQEYKAESGLLDKIHAEDRIKFSVGETGGNKTITKIERQ